MTPAEMGLAYIPILVLPDGEVVSAPPSLAWMLLIDRKEPSP